MKKRPFFKGFCHILGAFFNPKKGFIAIFFRKVSEKRGIFAEDFANFFDKKIKNVLKIEQKLIIMNFRVDQFFPKNVIIL